MTAKTVVAQLHTTNLKESVNFYTSKLGFELEFEYSDFYAGIRIAEAQLIHLKLVDDPDPSIDFVRNNGHLHLFLTIDDAVSTAEDLRVKGVTFHSEISNTPWGTTEFHVLDDQGHVLCFAQEGHV